MIEFAIEQLMPAFLRADRGALACAKAMEAALRVACRAAQDAHALVCDVYTMPEWRLDELAWEYGCLYDYGAAVEQKRRWIASAMPMTALLGTPKSLCNYLEGYFEGIKIEEGTLYGAQPYHFRVTVAGDVSPQSAAWAQRAIEAAKNVRSVFDGVGVGADGRIVVSGSGAVAGAFCAPLCGQMLCGLYPQAQPSAQTAAALDAALLDQMALE